MKVSVTLSCALLVVAIWQMPEDCLSADVRQAESAPSAAACANLSPQGFTLFGPQIVYPGESIGHRMAAFARNVGTDSSLSMWVGFYLSADTDISTGDILLWGGREHVGAIQPGFVEPVYIASSMSIPDWIPDEPWYLGIIVDEDNDVLECNEGDNTAFIPIVVAAPTASVLTVPEPYDNPSDALAAASDGDTIRIAAGVYDDSLYVTKSVVFQGAGAASTRLMTSLNDSAIVTVSNASPVFTGLEFYGGGGATWVTRGIWVSFGSVQSDQCTFTNIGNFSIQADTSAIMLDSVRFIVQNTVSDVGLEANSSTFTVRNCYGGTGIDHVFDPRIRSLGVIENCTIDGSGVFWANGIRVRDQSAAVLRNNLIRGQHSDTTSPSLTVGGIAAAGPCFVEVDGNTVQGFTYGMIVSDESSVRAHGNSITGNIVEGIHMMWSPKLDLGGGQWQSPGCNHIYDNGSYNVRSSIASPVYALNNDWGTGKPSAIDALLYDNDENPTLGQVLYSPFGACSPAGLNVKLWLGFIQLTFDEILQSGVTSIVEDEAGPPPPPEFVMVPPNPVLPALYFEFATTARFVGNVEIGLPYDETKVNGSETAVRLFHYLGDAWQDITSVVDVNANIVYGITTSFSPFIVAGPRSCCSGTTGNVNMTGIVNSLDLAYLIQYLTPPAGPALPCSEEANVNATGIINSLDLAFLIQYLTPPAGPELPPCP